MTEKRKLPVVQKRRGDDGASYGLTQGVYFAWVSSPEEGRTQASAFCGCREYLNRIPHLSLGKKKGSSLHDPEVDAPVDFNKFRLLITGPGSDNKSKLFSAKAKLNLLEELAGWEKSKISTVKHPLYNAVWLVTGPKEWMSTPQLVSLATFVLRFCTQHGPFNAGTYDDFEVEIHNYLKDHRTVSAASDIVYNLATYWDKMYVLMKHSREVFGGIDIDTAWDKNENVDNGVFGISSGIRSFWEDEDLYDVAISDAATRFRDLCSKILPRKIQRGGKVR